MFWMVLPAAAADPVVHVPKEPVHAHQEVTMELVETLSGTLFISGCAAVEVERRWGAEWRPEPVASCAREVSAMGVDGRADLKITVDDPGIYRIRVAWGAGCAAGWSFVRAGCRRLGVITSDEFEVIQVEQR